MSIKVSTQLKALNTRLLKAEQKHELLKNELNQKQSEYNKIKNDIEKIKNEIENLKGKSKEIIISEHCILRYIERVLGIDMAKINDSILNKNDQARIKLLGANCTYQKEGFKIKIVDNTAVTIIV